MTPIGKYIIVPTSKYHSQKSASVSSGLSAPYHQNEQRLKEPIKLEQSESQSIVVNVEVMRSLRNGTVDAVLHVLVNVTIDELRQWAKEEERVVQLVVGLNRRC